MKKQFEDILNISGVLGMAFFSPTGELFFSEASAPYTGKLEQINWIGFGDALGAVREAEFFFDAHRFYLRKTNNGYILIILNRTASISMVRLNCDIILPGLEQVKKNKGLGRFFKR